MIERMFDLFLAQLLVLGMTIIVCIRFLFTKYARIDAIVIFSPLATFFALLVFFNWGAELLSTLILLLSFVVLITNMRALYRLSAQLYVDHYNAGFIAFSVIYLALALLFTFICVVFHPVKYRLEDFGVQRTAQSLTGSFSNGYQVRKSLFEKSHTTGILYTYEKEALESEGTPEADKNAPLVLFVPKSTSSVVHYEPYLIMLAQKGYRVLAADFYSPFPRLYSSIADARLFRRVYTVFLSLVRKDAYAERQEDIVQLNLLGYESLSNLALSCYGEETKLFYVIDAINLEKLQGLTTAFSKNSIGFFAVNRVDEYKTSGYGFIEQTEPLLARHFQLERDKTFLIPRYAASKTDESIKNAVKLATPVEIIRASESGRAEAEAEQ